MHGAELLVQELGVLLPGAADGAPGLQSQLHDQVQVHEANALVLGEHRSGETEEVRQGSGIAGRESKKSRWYRMVHGSDLPIENQEERSVGHC